MIQAVWNGTVLTVSEDAKVVEGNHYFPPQSVRRDLLQPSQTQSVCAWKGTADYYTITVDGQTNPDAAFTYASPSEAATGIKNHVAWALSEESAAG